MKHKHIKVIALLTVILIICAVICGCEAVNNGSRADIANTREVTSNLQYNQPTPTDIEYSLERYNLIRRAYWVNGQQAKADALVCPVDKPLGYVVLLTESGATVGSFAVDGKVSSLNSFLTPDSEKYSGGEYSVSWIADVDGSYGENDSGIFFFTPDGHYYEWTGLYLYSDLPFEIGDTVINVVASVG